MAAPKPSFLKRLVLFFHSIRFRLSMWFGLVLAVILFSFSIFVYYRQAKDAYTQASARLAIRINEMNLALSQALRNEDDNWLNIPGITSGGSFTLREGEVVVLINRFGRVTTFSGAITEEQAKTLAYLAMQQEPNNSLTIQSLSTDKKNEVSTYLFISSAIGNEMYPLGWITLGQQLDPYGLLNRLKWTLIFANIATFLAALAGGYWLADRALHPVKTITRTAQQISASGLDRRLNLKTQDELGELANTFDQMLDRLQSAFIRQRQFTADASHELRTPLTIIGLETSRALSGSRTPAEYHQALEIVDSENRFMTRLVEELLTLARMDAGQVNLKREPVDLSDLALEITERFEPIAAQKGIHILTGDLPELFIEGDRQILAQAIGNLVDNAIKYSLDGEDQWVRVETGQYAETKTAWVRVSDNGPGIEAKHLSHLFDRFYRVDQVRSHNQAENQQEETLPGSGLGLSIVQWIVQIHGGRVEVMSEVGKGTTFEARFPLPAKELTTPKKASSPTGA